MNIYPNAYYNYIKNRKKCYIEEKTNIQREMVRIYHDNNGIPGYRMTRDYLMLKGIQISYPTAFKYFHELGLYSIVRRNRYEYKKGPEHTVFPNLINQNFDVDNPNEVWATDFTYMIQPNGTKYYNCTIIDLCNRDVVASLNGKHITSELAIKTLKKALGKRKPPKGIILHHDQGSQFGSKEFVKFCRDNHVQQSMSRAGCPYDNAPMERFYNTFKNEFYNLYKFKTIEELDRATYHFVYVKYNYQRPHSHNNGLPPARARLVS